MRFWHAAAFLLIACGGKIATESTGVGQAPGAGDDDDDTPPTVSSSSGYSSTSGHLGKPGHSSGDVPTPKPYPHPGSGSSSGFDSGAPSSGETLCRDLSMVCGGAEQIYQCSIEGPPGTPGLKCWGAMGQTTVKCTCFGTYLDAGSSVFAVPAPKQLEAKELYSVWQKYCGGSCN